MCRLRRVGGLVGTLRQESVYYVTSFHILQVGGRVRSCGGGCGGGGGGGGGGDCSPGAFRGYRYHTYV